ncbi:hypothetical protein QJS10_CPB04g01009 [Acorus calamus]|uniref:Protein high chlorophyll fluorescent 107 n=1 Tax=Acorus calamus TaxID=4465 RepID=A0AAV9F049_ACOCL|nr:hypothetical protein QJS10_CPB04g01009 [Acorus calamus]
MQQILTSTKSQIPSLFPPQSPTNIFTAPPKSFPKIPIKSPLHVTLRTSSSSNGSPPSVLDESLLFDESDDESDSEDGRKSDAVRDGLLVVRRPQANEVLAGRSDGGRGDPGPINAGLSEFAKKMPMFEPPPPTDADPKARPLEVNREIALYRAKVLTRNFKFKEAEEILKKCLSIWPEDGRAYVALGKLLSKQSRTEEARSVYEIGCQATQGENSYIWQCWAVLENKAGNVRRARELFDAATVADKRHVAAWHGWAVLEIKQGNVKKGRHLLAKGLKFCGGNEYIYQTLALLEARGGRFEQARYLFRQATICNPKSCASWLAWAQVEMQQENNYAARRLFEKAVQASPKNRFAWHVWGIFEANQGFIDKGRKLLNIGRALNPRDPVLLQSLALLEYKYSTANLAQVLFRRASELDPRHQPVWIAWGWMEWKEGNLATARELYQKALSINSSSESAARCLQAWGVLEQRVGNLSAARRLFRSSLNINSQSYVTWMTWASLEEEQGNAIRAEEIRNLYFQQRTEVVDDASWVMGFLDVIDPALDSIKRLLKLDQNPGFGGRDALRDMTKASSASIEGPEDSSSADVVESVGDGDADTSNFDIDAFVRDKLSLDTSNLDAKLESSEPSRYKSPRRIWRSENRNSALARRG